MSNLEFAILKRRDADYSQFAAGGGEDAESPAQADKRETDEEIGIMGDSMRLGSMNTVWKNRFAATSAWSRDLFVIPEHCFTVDARDSVIVLSRGHTEFR